MKLVFIHDHKFIKINDSYYSTGKFSEKTLNNYKIPPIKKIEFISRIQKNNYSEKNLVKASSNHIEIQPITFLKKKVDFLLKRKQIETFIDEHITGNEIVIIRLPSEIGYIAMHHFKKRNIDFGIELVGDPWEALWYHGSILGKFMAVINKYKTKHYIYNAKNVMYVTQKYLQEKYPTNFKSYTASNVFINNINSDYKVKTNQIYKIGLIGSLDTEYKGIDTALKSLSLIDENFIFEIVGNGPQEKWLEKIKKYNLEEKVVLKGAVQGGDPINEWLKELDLYIQPSYTEGLPRALIEAMSNGIPCLGSNAGGIPELLDSKFIHKVKDYKTFSYQLEEVLHNTRLRKEMSEINLKRAENYLSGNIQRQREAFIKSIYEEK